MKRILPALLLALTLTACEKPHECVELEPAYIAEVAWANFSDNAKLYTTALNREKLLLSSGQHLPLHRIDSESELEGFREDFGGILTLSSGWDGVQSFEELTKSCDAEFFEEKTLFLVYVSSPSESIRYELSYVESDGEHFVAHVRQRDGTEYCTEMMAGWFVAIEVPRDEVAQVREFDAVMEDSDGHSYTNSYAKWSPQSQIMLSPLNGGKLLISSVQHLPLHRIDSAAQLSGFRERYDGVFEITGAASGLDELTSHCDDGYFEKNVLFFVYVSSSGEPSALEVTRIYNADGCFTVYVSRSSGADLASDLPGALIAVEVPRESLADVREFDAVMDLAGE